MDNSSICVIIKVANDANIILNILNSTLPYARDYIIYDLNSSDCTIEFCDFFFNENKNIGKTIIRHDGSNIKYLDQYLLQLGKKYSSSEYVWLYDTSLIIHGSFKIPQLGYPAYSLKHKIMDKISSKSHIFSNSIEWEEIGEVTKNIIPVNENIYFGPGKIEGDYYLTYRYQPISFITELCVY